MRRLFIMGLFLVIMLALNSCGGEQTVTYVGIETTPTPLTPLETEENLMQSVLEDNDNTDVLLYGEDCWLIDRPPGLVYSLSTDAHIQSLSTGATSANTIFYTPYLMPSGESIIYIRRNQWQQCYSHRCKRQRTRRN
jgi:hypothetical protein